LFLTPAVVGQTTTTRWLAAALVVLTLAMPVVAENREITDVGAPNTLTEQEQADGWELLFDGESLDKWRGFRMEEVPEGWAAEDGCLVCAGGGVDLVTRDEFDDFELSLEWKIGEGGNSGIFFNVVEDYDRTYDSGPEFQVLDNSKHNDGKNTKTSAGANYALIAPAEDVTRPIGEFNDVLIRVKGNHVEHYMNGQKLLEYDLGSEAWRELVAASKFSSMPGYGKSPRGHLALQDHGDKVYFRNIKVRKLDRETSPTDTHGGN
jgi:hypothetical protein